MYSEKLELNKNPQFSTVVTRSYTPCYKPANNYGFMISFRLKKKDIVPPDERDGQASVVVAASVTANVAEINSLPAPVSNENSLLVNNDIRDNQRVPEITIEGRRIVDISYLLQQLHEKLDNHNVMSQCSFRDIKLVYSFDRGLRTNLHFQCHKCLHKFNNWTDPDLKNIMGINQSAVCGTITSGTGHSTLQEQLAAMGIPAMTANTYMKYRDRLFDNFHEVVEAERERAIAEEKKIAIKKGHIINGIPYIDVIADGCWAKRSYAGGKHDALSGAAMIIGRETKLALFVGVRNKYCAIHARAEQFNEEPPSHICYKNWGLDTSSNAMETDIIVEGFRTSLERNGLIYKTLIADGDSSVYQAIRDSNPYAEYGVIVEKIECNNHLFRNLCRKLRAASTTKLAKPPLKEVQNVTQFRQYVVSSGLKIRLNVEKVRDLRMAENIPEDEKITKLCIDILNVFSHVYGDHSNCQTLPFDCAPELNGKNVLAELHRTGLYPCVYETVRYLSCHAKSLLRNVTNNTAEACNSIVNKLNSGKRINHCMRNSYQMRCYGAVVQFNTQSLLSKLHRNVNHYTATVVTKMESNRQRKNYNNRLYNLPKRNCRLRSRRRVDKDYGPSARKPDIDKQVFDVLAERHMDKLKSHQKNARQIERDTVSQSNSELWHQLRTEIITASKFGPICRMLPTTSCANMVASIRYPKVIDNAAIHFGLENEENARRDIVAKLGIKIVPCGLFIDQEIPYLGASPDGLIDDDGIVEIKCPYSAQNADLDKVITEKPNLRNIFDRKDKNFMNENHVHYYQVQGQLHVTKRHYCIFALWSSTDMILVKVTRDDGFWDSKMKPFLCQFYIECLIPEIIDSRRNRNMRIRDPTYILQARKAAALRRKRACSIDEPDDVQNCTTSTDISLQPPAKTTVASVDFMNVTSVSSKTHEDTIIEEWIEIEVDGDNEASDEAIEMLEIVRRNITVEEVEANVLSPGNLLTDSSIDLFQNIIQENSDFRCNPASYTAYHNCIKPCNPLQRDIQIIGGNVS